MIDCATGLFVITIRLLDGRPQTVQTAATLARVVRVSSLS